MRIVIRTTLVEKQKLAALFRGIAELGNLGSREIEKIADAGRRGISDLFTREESPDGESWTPLAPFTQTVRSMGIDERNRPFRTGRRHPIMVRTGDLRQSFTEPSHTRNITNVGRGGGVVRITLGAEDDPETPGRISTLHSGGTTPEGRQVPARPFVGLSDDAVERLEDTSVFVIDERVKRLP